MLRNVANVDQKDFELCYLAAVIRQYSVLRLFHTRVCRERPQLPSAFRTLSNHVHERGLLGRSNANHYGISRWLGRTNCVEFFFGGHGNGCNGRRSGGS